MLRQAGQAAVRGHLVPAARISVHAAAHAVRIDVPAAAIKAAAARLTAGLR
jgi:hypothetical protein